MKAGCTNISIGARSKQCSKLRIGNRILITANDKNGIARDCVFAVKSLHLIRKSGIDTLEIYGDITFPQWTPGVWLHGKLATDRVLTVNEKIYL